LDAVISTGGGQGLIDGSFIRRPHRGWCALEIGKNMEPNPAIPDAILDNSPTSTARGEAEQLKKSIELLLEQIDGGN